MSIESTAVSNAMARDVKTAKEGKTIKTVAKIMTDNNIESVVIVKNAEMRTGRWASQRRGTLSAWQGPSKY